MFLVFHSIIDMTPLQGDSLQDTKETRPGVCKGCRLPLLEDGGTWEVYPGLVG